MLARDWLYRASVWLCNTLISIISFILHSYLADYLSLQMKEKHISIHAIDSWVIWWGDDTLTVIGFCEA